MKALQAPELQPEFYPVLVGHRQSLYESLKKWGQNFSQLSSDRYQVNRHIARFVEIAPEITASIRPGQPSKQGGIIAGESIREAAKMATRGIVDAIVTGPVNKNALHQVGLKYPGQTEFLAELTNTASFAMMLIGGKIRVVMVTTHIPLAKVAEELTIPAIVEKIDLTHAAMGQYFACSMPEIAVTALNPHAGDEGCFGSEEKDIIEPAIRISKQKGIRVSGPLPADSLFPLVQQGQYDAVVAMYHDQGIIPVKLEAFGRGINLTLGLPFLRTSVDHGTAYDIAGKGIADEKSMIMAIKTAFTLIARVRNNNRPGESTRSKTKSSIL